MRAYIRAVQEGRGGRVWCRILGTGCCGKGLDGKDSRTLQNEIGFHGLDEMCYDRMGR